MFFAVSLFGCAPNKKLPDKVITVRDLVDQNSATTFSNSTPIRLVVSAQNELNPTVTLGHFCNKKFEYSNSIIEATENALRNIFQIETANSNNTPIVTINYTVLSVTGSCKGLSFPDCSQSVAFTANVSLELDNIQSESTQVRGRGFAENQSYFSPCDSLNELHMIAAPKAFQTFINKVETIINSKIDKLKSGA